MKVGVFDHLDRNALSLTDQYEQRLRLIEAYEQAGFYAYHLAEHHSTPLGMAPSPSVFLAAVAQRTTCLRFGPLVYPLPFHHPLRAAEEICMLDQLSGGRLEVGVGRGSSPHELRDYGIDPAEAQARYFEAFVILRQALAGHVDFEGKFYRFQNVPMEIAPVQRPHPPFWYGVGNPEGMTWAAENAINVVCNGPTSLVKAVTERYRAAWLGQGRSVDTMPFIAMNRFVVVADSDEKAREIGKRAYRQWHARFFHLWNSRGSKPTYATYPETFEELVQIGYATIGNPDTVRTVLARQLQDAGNNYFVGRFAFGDLTLDEVDRSVRLFAKDVLPALSLTPALTP